MATTVPLGKTDRFFIKMETRDTPAHTASLSIFRLAENAPQDAMQQLATRLRNQPVSVAPFNYRLAPGSKDSAWEILDPSEVDLDYHFRHSALPWPGGERELGQLISRLHAHPLDFKRPPWEFHLIEGLERGRFATYMKMHHSLADGGAVIKIITDSLSRTPDERATAPWARISAAPAGNLKKPPLPDLADNKGLRTLLSALGSVASAAHRQPRTGFVGPFAAPQSVLNTRVTQARRYATQQFAISRLKAVAGAAGVTLNDVFLGVLGGALRRYLLEINALPDRPLITNVPVALERDEGDSLGNAVTIIYATLATDVTDPVERLRIISDSTQKGKQFLSKLKPSQIDILSALTFIPLVVSNSLGLSAIERHPIANVASSNVPGPRHRLWLEGAVVEALYPCSMLVQNCQLNITARGYCDLINIGFIGGRDALPHFQHLAVYTSDALEELERCFGLDNTEAKSAA